MRRVGRNLAVSALASAAIVAATQPFVVAQSTSAAGILAHIVAAPGFIADLIAMTWSLSRWLAGHELPALPGWLNAATNAVFYFAVVALACTIHDGQHQRISPARARRSVAVPTRVA